MAAPDGLAPLTGTTAGGGSVIPMTTACSTEERVARLEGGYEHLATKADLAAMESRLLCWLVPTVAGGMVAAAAISQLV